MNMVDSKLWKERSLRSKCSAETLCGRSGLCFGKKSRMNGAFVAQALLCPQRSWSVTRFCAQADCIWESFVHLGRSELSGAAVVGRASSARLRILKASTAGGKVAQYAPSSARSAEASTRRGKSGGFPTANLLFILISPPKSVILSLWRLRVPQNQRSGNFQRKWTPLGAKDWGGLEGTWRITASSIRFFLQSFVKMDYHSERGLTLLVWLAQQCTLQF